MRSSHTKSKRNLIAGADFETDHTPDGSKAWVCQWAVVVYTGRAGEKGGRDGTAVRRSNYVTYHGYTLQEFEQCIDRLRESSRAYTIYFHNLRYDMQYMRGYLFRLQEETPLEDRLTIIRSGKPIILRYGSIEFRDSANKMPAGTTVQQMGEMIGIPKLESPRGNFDAGWSKDLTEADFQYVEHDAMIVADMMHRIHALGRTHATSSGDAWASMRAIFNKEHNVNGYGQWNRYFPEISQDMDDFLREGYFGGINISRHIGLNRGSICHIDRNSQYPSVMAAVPTDGVVPILPYGTPYHTTDPEKDGYELYVMRAEFKFKLKKGMIPWFKFKHKYDRDLEGLGTSEPVTKCAHWHELTLTNVDIKNLMMFYDVFVNEKKPVYYVGFDSAPGLLKSYIDYWYEQKAQAKASGDRVAYLSAKLMMNSAYGRFGMSSRSEDSSFVWDADLGDYDVCSEEYIGDKVPGYLPYAMFVTAWARFALLTAVKLVGCENVIHCDTDSVIYIGTPEMSDALGHTSALGDWGIESQPVAIYEGGVKRYIEFFTDEPKTLKDIAFTCAGVPQKQKDGRPSGMWVELLDDPDGIYDTGRVLGQTEYRIRSEWLRQLTGCEVMNTMKLLPYKTQGGVLLNETTFKLHDMMVTRYR